MVLDSLGGKYGYTLSQVQLHLRIGSWYSRQYSAWEAAPFLKWLLYSWLTTAWSILKLIYQQLFATIKIISRSYVGHRVVKSRIPFSPSSPLEQHLRVTCDACNGPIYGTCYITRLCNNHMTGKKNFNNNSTNVVVNLCIVHWSHSMLRVVTFFLTVQA